MRAPLALILLAPLAALAAPATSRQLDLQTAKCSDMFSDEVLNAKSVDKAPGFDAYYYFSIGYFMAAIVADKHTGADAMAVAQAELAALCAGDKDMSFFAAVLLAASHTLTAESHAAPETLHSYPVVDPADVFVAPSKYFGTPIQLKNMHCYYAKEEDIRCTTSGGVHLSVFAETINQEIEQWLSRHCDKLAKLSSRECAANIGLVYREDHVKRDWVNGTEDRVVIRPGAIIAARPQPGKQKRH